MKLTLSKCELSVHTIAKLPLHSQKSNFFPPQTPAVYTCTETKMKPGVESNLIPHPESKNKIKLASE